MKRIFLTVFTLGFLSMAIVSCQSEKKDSASDSTSVAAGDSTNATAPAVGTAEDTKATAAEMAKVEVPAPNFSVSEINDVIKEFNTLKEEYVSAIEKNDATGIKTAQDKYNVWVGKAAALGVNKLPKEENQQYITYYQKLARQWEIAGKAIKK